MKKSLKFSFVQRFKAVPETVTPVAGLFGTLVSKKISKRKEFSKHKSQLYLCCVKE